MSLAQLSQLLPLPDDELKQVLDYASTLSKSESASHFGNLLGDSPLAIDFIASFNSRRKEPITAAASSSSGPGASASTNESHDAVPNTKRGPKKKKAPLHALEARKVDEYAAPAGTVYNKKDQSLDYISQRSSGLNSKDVSRSNTPKSTSQHGPSQPPKPLPPKQHASSSGFLISDHPNKPKSKSNQSSRSSTPKPGGNPTKISIAGGTPMAGKSTALDDLDAAIRALEITTNPKLDDAKSRRCNCVATRHPLQSAAPNCLSCGKVICMKEGLGPCTHCGTALLTPDEVQAMVRELKSERGKERMAADAKSHRRAEVSKKPAPFTQPRDGEGSAVAEAEVKAREHRDKLLNFQAQNARRTTVRDEAADFDVTGAMSGTGNMWSTPEERAKELKRQQKIMREMEWNARPEYEKRQQIVSIDLVGGKVVRKMAGIERPESPPSAAEDDDDGEANWAERAGGGRGTGAVLSETSGNRGGAFSGNPLLGSLIRPVFQPPSEGKGKGAEEAGPAERRDRRKRWRRVQDDQDDNEGVILDGGIYGHGGRGESGARGGDEPACG